MTSPSISNTNRNTPWAAGCCGPKFIVKLRISGIGFACRRRGARTGELWIVAIVVANYLRHENPRFDRDRLVNDAALLRVVANLDVPGQREILAERMADEPVIGQYAPQIRMSPKEYSE